MSHARTSIVTAVASLLTGLQTTQNRVCKTRVYSRDESELPSVSVFFDGEESTAQTLKGNARVYARTATLRIVGHAFDLDGIETKLDDMAAEIETAMSADIVAQTKVIPATLVSTSIDTATTEQQIGEVTLTYRVFYATLENAPGTLI